MHSCFILVTPRNVVRESDVFSRVCLLTGGSHVTTIYDSIVQSLRPVQTWKLRIPPLYLVKLIEVGSCPLTQRPSCLYIRPCVCLGRSFGIIWSWNLMSCLLILGVFTISIWSLGINGNFLGTYSYSIQACKVIRRSSYQLSTARNGKIVRFHFMIYSVVDP